SFQTLRDPVPFGVMAHLYPGVNAQDVLGAIDGEIQAIALGRLSEGEIARARRKFQAEILDSFQGSETRAYWLGIYTHLNRGNSKGFEEDLNRYLTGINKDDICRAAALGYLQASKRSVLEVAPSAEESPAQDGQGARWPREPSLGQATGRPTAQSFGDGCKASGPYRQKPPAAKSEPGLARKKVKEFRLKNGWRVLLVEDHRLPFVKIRISFPLSFPAAYDDESLDRWAALGDALADLFTAGTKSKDNEAIESELAILGASLDAGAGKDTLAISASVLSETALDLFKLAAEILSQPQFPQDELDKWKERAAAELKDQKTRAEFLREVRWADEMFGRHPYGVTAPSEKAVRRVAREDLFDFHRLQYAGPAVMTVVGDVKKDGLKKMLDETLGRLDGQGGPRRKLRLGLARMSKGRRIVVVNRPGSVQSEISLGHLSITRADPDYYALSVLNMVFGGLFYSRLNRNLREEKGYTYGIGSSLRGYFETGVFKIGTAVGTKVTAVALDEIFKEIGKIIKSGVTREELHNAKTCMVGATAIAQATQDHLADQLSGYAALGLPSSELHRFRDKVRAVTRSQALRAARKHLKPERALVIVVGDASKIVKDLERFGDVIVVDGEGNLGVAPPGAFALANPPVSR
ncbi:MAG: pitrilysin family protein, partial [Elusimicrobiota bacterium]